MSSMGECYSVRYLGCAPLLKFSSGLSVLQKPLHDLYVSFLTSKGPRQLTLCRLATTDRGIILTMDGNDSFYSMPNILLWEAVHWVKVQTKDRKYLSAFEPLDPDRHRSKSSLFSKLDKQFKYLVDLPHPYLFACVLRRTSGTKALDVHGFVCSSEEQVLDIVANLNVIQDLFSSQEVHSSGVFDYKPFNTPGASVRSTSGLSSFASPPLSLTGSEFVDPRRKPPASIQETVSSRKTYSPEDLLLLADMALSEPKAVAAAARPREPFQMGESWAAKDERENQPVVRRSRTFNEVADGVSSRRQTNYNSSFQMDQHAQAYQPERMQAQCKSYYENMANPNRPEVRTRSTDAPETRSPLVQPRQQRLLEDPKRKSAAPESLRAVINENRLANQRASVLPSSDNALRFTSDDDFASRSNHQQVMESSSRPGSPDPTPTPKPVAMVQPRKVTGVRVLPLDGFQLQKVPQKTDGEPRVEQYQAQGGRGNQVSRSMFELNQVGKPTTPQVQRKQVNPDTDPIIRDTKEEKPTDKQKVVKQKKDAELQSFAMNINFDRDATNTLSPHGTNFERALGYFP